MTDSANQLSRWELIFREAGLYWSHDGNPAHPHALLTSGLHSNGFFNGSGVIGNPLLCSPAAEALLSRVELPTTGDLQVFGSALGASTLAFEMARQLDVPCGFTEPVLVNGLKIMQLKRFTFAPGTQILVVEDVMTTGGTTLETIAALEAAGGVVLPDIAVLVNRSGCETLDGRVLQALVTRHLPIWTAEKCPLCAGGSQAIRPKANWDALTNP